MNRSKRDREIQSLTDRLAALKSQQPVAPGKKKKKRRKNASQTSTPGTSGLVSTPGTSNKSGKTRGANGSIRLRRRELLSTLKPTNGKLATSRFLLAVKSFTWLKTVGAAFEHVKFNMLNIWYVPAVGATKNGMIALGVDYSFKKEKPTHEQVIALTPSITMPIWQSNERNPIKIPKGQLQSRALYLIEGATEDSCPGALLVAFDGDSDVTFLGDLWVEYDVELSGTVF